MEAQVYLYMWDNRWAWGLPFPERPSWVWVGLLALKAVSYGNALWHWHQLVLFMLIFTMALRQRAVENVRYMPFRLDEDKHRIGHYFKRRDALYTHQAAALLLVGFIKVGLSVYHWGVAEGDNNLAAWADVFASMNIVFLFCIQLISKFITLEFLQKKFPFEFASFKSAWLRYTSPVYKATITKSSSEFPRHRPKSD